MSELATGVVAKALQEICRTSYGPHGRLKAVQHEINGDYVVLTSASSRLLHACCFERPEAKLIAEVARQHCANFGDCGLFLVMVSTGMLENLQELSVHHLVVSSALGMALQACEDAVSDPGCKFTCNFDWGRAVHCGLPVVKSILGSKALLSGLTCGEMNVLSARVLEAFISSTGGSSAYDGVRIATVTGGTVLDTSVVNGIVLDTPWPPHAPTSLEHLPGPIVTIVFETALIPADTGPKSTVISSTACAPPVHDELLSIGSAIVEALRKHGGAAVVACQRGIDPWLRLFLLDHGILPLERLSTRHVHSFAALAGAVVLSDASFPQLCTSLRDERVVGTLTSVSLRRSLSSKHIEVEGGGVSLTTLILHGPDIFFLEEAEVVARNALTVLAHLLEAPYVVPGAGCIERCLADVINGVVPRLDKKVASQRQCAAVLEMFVSVLLRIANTLCDGHDSDEPVPTILTTDCVNCYGWNVSSEAFEVVARFSDNKEVLDATILESLSVKLAALQSAVEVVSMLHRVASIVRDPT